MLDNVTWVCHVCGDIRPDDKISVRSSDTELERTDIKITQNVRYCNDKQECIEGAKKVRWIGEE